MSTDPTSDPGPAQQPQYPWASDPAAPTPTPPSPWTSSPTEPAFDSGSTPGAAPAPGSYAPPPAASPYGPPSAPSPYGAPQAPPYGVPPSYGSTPNYAGAPPVPAYPAYGAGYGLEHPQGTIVLILGILGIVVCGLCAPFAWVMGRKALREIDASGQTYTNRGQAQAGMICGIVGTILWALAIVGYAVMIIGIFGMAAASGGVR